MVSIDYPYTMDTTVSVSVTDTVYNNNYYLSNSNLDTNTDRDGIEPKNDSEFCKADNNGDGTEPKKTKSFCKPTVEEIQEYCNQRGNSVDANNFYDFYESKGWMIGKNKMKDWKACVRTWEKGRKENSKPSTKNTYQDNLTGQYGDLSQFYMN